MGSPEQTEHVAEEQFFLVSNNVGSEGGIAAFGYIPFERIEALGGLTIPVKRIDSDDGIPARVVVSPRDISEAFQAWADAYEAFSEETHNNAGFWDGYRCARMAWHGKECPADAQNFVSFPYFAGTILTKSEAQLIAPCL